MRAKTDPMPANMRQDTSIQPKSAKAQPSKSYECADRVCEGELGAMILVKLVIW